MRNVQGMDFVFLATGTGIAPVKAMLEEISSISVQARPRSISIFRGRIPSDLYWDVNSIPCGHRYFPVLSQAGNDWTGARGYVQQVLTEAKLDLLETVVYACGSDAMIHSAKEALLKAGLPERRFMDDVFVCSAAS